MKRIYSKHKMTGHKIHEVWKEMLRRCRGTSKNSIEYKKNGICVCKEWENASIFISWAFNNGYTDGLKLDRKDNNNGYSPDNCRWVTARESANNKKNTMVLSFEGKEMCLWKWSELTGINRQTLYTRLRRGWSVEKTLTKQVVKL